MIVFCRANTGSSVTSFKSRYQRFIHEPDGIYPAIAQRHAHFSSAESVEHGKQNLLYHVLN